MPLTSGFRRRAKTTCGTTMGRSGGGQRTASKASTCSSEWRFAHSADTGLMVRSRRYGSRRGHFYTCSANWRRGSCDNQLEIPAEMAEAAVLESVESELLTPAVIECAIERLFAQAAAPASELADRRACLQNALRTIEIELPRPCERRGRGWTAGNADDGSEGARTAPRASRTRD